MKSSFLNKLGLGPSKRNAPASEDVGLQLGAAQDLLHKLKAGHQDFPALNEATRLGEKPIQTDAAAFKTSATLEFHAKAVTEAAFVACFAVQVLEGAVSRMVENENKSLWRECAPLAASAALSRCLNLVLHHCSDAAVSQLASQH